MRTSNTVVVRDAYDAMTECDLFLISAAPNGTGHSKILDEFFHDEKALIALFQSKFRKLQNNGVLGFCTPPVAAGAWGTPWDVMMVAKTVNPWYFNRQQLLAARNALMCRGHSTAFEDFISTYTRDAPGIFNGGIYVEIPPTDANREMISDIFGFFGINFWMSECPYGSDVPYKEIWPCGNHTPR